MMDRAQQALYKLALAPIAETLADGNSYGFREGRSCGNNYRQADWSESVAVGSKDFVETIKEKLGLRAKGRKILENDAGFQLREKMVSYIVNSDSKNDNIGGQNTFFWDVNHEFTGS